MKTLQLTLNENAEKHLENIKNVFGDISDQESFILMISLTSELSKHIDKNGYLPLTNELQLK